jgi:hypothetical protein
MVQYPDTIVGKNVTARLTGVTMSEIETTYKRKRKGCSGDILSWKSNGNHNSDALHTKPILRPLSSMTEEEFTEVVFLFYGKENRDIVTQKFSKVERYTELKHSTKFGTSIPYKCFDFEGNPILMATFSNKMNPEQFVYCLSIGLDLFGLIESGEAITAVPQSPQ